MDYIKITIEDIKPMSPFSQGSTEIFLTGQWSSRKPLYVEKTSPCRVGCPVGNDISRAFYLASKGDLDGALKVFREENPLPGVCGRVCYHPCESLCNRKEFDSSINIRGFERFLADNGRMNIAEEMAKTRKKERVAIVGSGPAGLSAAYHLVRLGFPVTVFEAMAEPGGMLMYGIPAYRLPRDVLKREIDYIKALGVEIKTNTRIGKDIDLASLKREYQALFISVGAHKAQGIGVEGEDLSGVMDGIGFLRDVHLGKRIRLNRRVIVVGGGNTAIDCARVARRKGAKEVTIIYRRSMTEMPALKEDIEWAQREGVKIMVLTAPKRIVGTENKVSSIECIRMELGEPDGTGRPRPIPISGSEFVLPADVVISAVGQSPDLGFLDDSGISITKRGVIETSFVTGTNVDGIFAGGDSSGNKAYVADAIASGKMGAFAIKCYLEGEDVQKEVEKYRIMDGSSISFGHILSPETHKADLRSTVPYEKLNTLCFQREKREDNPEILKPYRAVRGFGETVGSLNREGMDREIKRCFKCGTCTQCDLCFLLCPDISIVKNEDGYGTKKDYCKGCSICATSCPRNVIEIGGTI
ncbi:MAG: NAD(P)-binding protein [Syntrophorhabdaceae bacterium]|nr:NAD(P)-binding protein [Syntrophorhabdaceae bacterium]